MALWVEALVGLALFVLAGVLVALALCLRRRAAHTAYSDSIGAFSLRLGRLSDVLALAAAAPVPRPAPSPDAIIFPLPAGAAVRRLRPKNLPTKATLECGPKIVSHGQ